MRSNPTLSATARDIAFEGSPPSLFPSFPPSSSTSLSSALLHAALVLLQPSSPVHFILRYQYLCFIARYYFPFAKNILLSFCLCPSGCVLLLYPRLDRRFSALFSERASAITRTTIHTATGQSFNTFDTITLGHIIRESIKDIVTCAVAAVFSFGDSTKRRRTAHTIIAPLFHSLHLCWTKRLG